MAKSKKSRDATSESEESTDSSSSSSSDSSSTESSSSEEESKKKRKLKKVSHTKVKMPRKESSSSSSSSSESETESSSSSSGGDDKPKMKKRKVDSGKEKKSTHSGSGKPKANDRQEKCLEQRGSRHENEEIRREILDDNNKSKWDSPSCEFDESRRERQRNRDRDYYENNYRNNDVRRYRKYEGNWEQRNFNRRNEYRDRLDRDRFRRRNRGQEYNNDREHDRDYDRNRDQNYRSRDKNYNDRRYDNRENRDRREDRENRRSRSPRRPKNFPRRHSGEDSKNYEWGKKKENEKSSTQPEDKEKPNFGLSGKLTEDANKVNGVVIKYAEPLEARKPKRRWRLYPFKGEKALPTLYIHRQSCYLIGRDRKVCDLPVDHPSCSKQHAALQYRLVPFEREDGTVGKRVRPYIIDLESANGTFINNKKIEPKKYIELLEKDVIKFGFSSREYVLLHENSKEDQQDDDITEEVQVKQEPAE